MLMSVTSDTIKSPILLDLNRLNKSMGTKNHYQCRGRIPKTNHTNLTIKNLASKLAGWFLKGFKYVGKSHTPNDLVVCFLFGGGRIATSSVLAMAPCPVVHPLVPRSKEVPFSMRQVGDGRYQNRFSVWILQTELVAWIPELSHNHGSGKLP